MRNRLMVLFAILVFVVLNFGIYQKQKIKDQGTIMLLELAPVDPRSLMQGDYMRLGYAIERVIPSSERGTQPKRGYLVVTLDEKRVAQFIRFHHGETLGSTERLIRFHKNGFIRIVPDSFFFQEGHAKFYETAKYGVFKFDNKGNHLLVGLADEHGKTIGVPE